MTDTVERPEWLVALDAACDASSQGKVAERLGYSSAAIGLVRRGAYTGRVDRIQQAVRGLLLNGKITCPELGSIPGQDCINHQKRAGSHINSNFFSVRMFTACHGCPRFTKKGDIQ